MVVHRQEKPEEEIEVELQKKSGKGAGLCLTGYKSGKGAYVSDLVILCDTLTKLYKISYNKIRYALFSYLVVALWSVERFAKGIEW